MTRHLTKIPVMPISYGERSRSSSAQRDGRSGRLARRTAHHISCRAGPAKVHLKLAFNWDIKPLYDVIVRIPGAPTPTSGSSAATITTPG